MAPDWKSGAHKPTFLDRHGQKGVSVIRALPGGIIGGMLAGIGAMVYVSRSDHSTVVSLLILLVVPLLTGFLVVKLLAGGAELAGAGFLSFLMPSGSSTPYTPQYSNVEAMVMRSDFAGAAAEYERIIAEAPSLADPRMRAAEVYARYLANPARAAVLLKEVQRLPGRTEAEDLRASNRLIDLLLAELNEPGRALVELRRLADRYKGTAAGEHAREAIARLKQEPARDGPSAT
jgi:hypothetical protein